MRYFVVTISVAIVSAAVAALLYFWLTVLVADHEKEVAANQKQIQSYGQSATELQSLLEAKANIALRKMTVERLTTQTEFKSDLLSEFSFLIPRNVWLTELTYSKPESKIEVKGRALTEAGVTQFVESLNSSASFHQVQQRSLIQDSSARPSEFIFSLDCLLRNGK